MEAVVQGVANRVDRARKTIRDKRRIKAPRTRKKSTGKSRELLVGI